MRKRQCPKSGLDAEEASPRSTASNKQTVCDDYGNKNELPCRHLCLASKMAGDQVLTFKKQLNAVFLDIEFTMEEEENNQLAFLDVLVCRKHCGGLKTSVQESDKYDANTELQ
ncbi:hypothetical protein SprV_0702332400 [Sparganum proliferum]